MNILYVVADNPNEWNSSRWRCAIPAQVVAGMPGNSAAMIPDQQFNKSYIEGNVAARAAVTADLIFYQRNMCTLEAYEAARYWRNQGKAVIVDLDDAYHSLPPSNTAWQFWYANGEAALNNLKHALPMLDGLTSPNSRILKEWEQFGVTRSWLVPNYALGSEYVNLVKEPHDGFIVGWGGSASHFDTWYRSGCAEGLRLACEARPDIRVWIWGSDKRMLEWLRLPEGRLVHKGYIMPKDVARWPRELAQFDLSLAPLGGDYDQHRSWLHALEPMLCKVPWLGTGGVPYRELEQWGHIVDDTAQAWADAIINAHDNYDSWQELAKNAYIHALGLTMERKAAEYLSLMFSIVQRRRAECGARLPGIITVS